MEYALNKQANLIDVNLKGDFTFADHEQFRAILFALTDSSGINTVTLDVSGITFIDSAGIGMLIIAHDESASRNQQLVIRGAQGQVKTALDITDLKSLIHMVDA